MARPFEPVDIETSSPGLPGNWCIGGTKHPVVFIALLLQNKRGIDSIFSVALENKAARKMIRVTAEALEYIEKHGQMATILPAETVTKLFAQSGVCVCLGKPIQKEVAFYDCCKYGSVTLYTPKGLLIPRYLGITVLFHQLVMERNYAMRRKKHSRDQVN